MPRVKVSITEVPGTVDRASGFDAATLQEAGSKAIGYIVSQTGVAEVKPDRMAAARAAKAKKAASPPKCPPRPPAPSVPSP